MPGLTTWPRVYVFVVAAFLLWVLLLTALIEDVPMNVLDYVVLIGTMVAIAGVRDLADTSSERSELVMCGGLAEAGGWESASR